MEYGKYRSLWSNLLSSKRFSESNGEIILTGSRAEEGRSPVEADIGRIVFSQPFRRLAGKTQVHPFATIDYIHNRLTHSIEVGHVSRALGRKIATFIFKNRGDLSSQHEIDEIGWICEAAGFMHDIGNPPYGHAGEDAIRAWAAQKEKDIKKLL